MLDTILRKVVSTVDVELLVMSAITFSNTDLSAANVVSLMPLTVRLADITSGVPRKIIYICIYQTSNWGVIIYIVLEHPSNRAVLPVAGVVEADGMNTLSPRMIVKLMNMAI